MTDESWARLAQMTTQQLNISKSVEKVYIIIFGDNAIYKIAVNMKQNKKPSTSLGGRISAKMPFPMGVVSRDPDFEGLPMRIWS